MNKIIIPKDKTIDLIIIPSDQLRSIIREEIQKATKQKQISTPEEDKLFTIEDIIAYLPDHPARQTIYGWINNRYIPYEKYGKRLYFRKSKIDIWINNGRQIY